MKVLKGWSDLLRFVGWKVSLARNGQRTVGKRWGWQERDVSQESLDWKKVQFAETPDWYCWTVGQVGASCCGSGLNCFHC